MTGAEPLQRIPVGVVVERRRAASPWASVLWRPVALLSGIPATAPWTSLGNDAGNARFYAGAAEIALYRSESENYRANLATEAPSVWVATQATEGDDPPCRIVGVTVDPAEGESYTEAGTLTVETIAMPEPLRETLAAFVAAHPMERGFEKRQRDRADPEALARRGPLTRSRS